MSNNQAKQPVVGWGGFFKDDKGNNSSMRVMCFIALLASIGFSAWIFVQVDNNNKKKLDLLTEEMKQKPPDIERLNTLKTINETDKGDEGISIVWAFLAAAFGGKFAQKFAEKDSETMGNVTGRGEPGAGP